VNERFPSPTANQAIASRCKNRTSVEIIRPKPSNISQYPFRHVIEANLLPDWIHFIEVIEYQFSAKDIDEILTESNQIDANLMSSVKS
jgi:hypothetical protein